ncbi:Rpp14/Pop5 family-domain-containing protein [Elsinoe ampelina]|uniref:Rpp14/Pop5 family-domain-containing protein n=1 Tax=Elsinoe ampelina TaxID=302913 RepID=A0A6A6GMG9_9PEZI|nr:Rpp14/Pop5 family-domain-containing protein [Elsinoe ampelina]
MVRIKHRYLLLQLLYPSAPSSSSSSSSPPSSDPHQFTLHLYAPTPDTLTPALLARLIRDQVSLLFGDHGAGLVASGLKVMYLSAPTSTAIVRVGRAQFRLVWAALTMVRRLPGTGVVVRVVRVSGTVRKCEEEVIRRGTEVVRRAKREGKEGGLGGWGEERVEGEGRGRGGIVDDEEDGDEDEDEDMGLDY